MDKMKVKETLSLLFGIFQVAGLLLIIVSCFIKLIEPNLFIYIFIAVSGVCGVMQLFVQDSKKQSGHLSFVTLVGAVSGVWICIIFTFFSIFKYID